MKNKGELTHVAELKKSGSLTFEKAKERAEAQHREDMAVISRKMLLGVDRTFTIKCVPDPSCKRCRGEGKDWNPKTGTAEGYYRLCWCVTTGEIIEKEEQ